MNRNRSKSRVDRTMPMVNPNAAAIDVGATMHMAAVGADRVLVRGGDQGETSATIRMRLRRWGRTEGRA